MLHHPVMQSEPAFNRDDTEVISFQSEIRGRVVTIAIDREAIEDLTGEEPDAEERLAFVVREKRRLVEAATRYLANALDADGILLTADLIG